MARKRQSCQVRFCARKKTVNIPVGLQKVGLEVDLEPVASEALNGVINGEDVDPLAILDIGAGCQGDHITKPKDRDMVFIR